MTELFPAITVQTCEQSAGSEPVHPLVPQRGEPPTQFLVQDPFGLRKAIVPVFWAGVDGTLTGQGTAFTVDPFGTFITADHVVADARRTTQPIRQHDNIRGAAEIWRFEMPTNESLVVFLGIGLIYGTVRGPPQAMSRIVEIWTPVSQGDNPMAALQGRPEGRPFDLALIRAKPWPPPGDWIRNLPFRPKARRLQRGDLVVAVGYPQIDTWRAHADEIYTIVKEGMFAGYGRVTRLYPRGRDNSNPTPVFEVEANWPPGMSGSPVFNLEGEVIGLVSRGLAPERDQPIGHAWATWFEAFPRFPEWAPTLDPMNPCWRQCWATLRREPWHLAGVSSTQQIADQLAARRGRGYEALQGAWRLGTNEFVTGARVTP